MIAEDMALDVLNGREHLDPVRLLEVKQAYSPYITYARNVFVPLTHVCRNRCGYCTFKKQPAPTGNIMKSASVMALVRRAETFHCSEVLFTFGERPEKYTEVRRELHTLGHDSIISYLYDLSETINDTTTLFVHSNPGVMEKEEIALLRPVTASMGLMLETVSQRLMDTVAHKDSPGKDPETRLATMRAAGQLRVPFTTGLLIGIGETSEEVYASLKALRDLHDRYGHIQEIIIQNFVPHPGTPMGRHAPPTIEYVGSVVSVARLMFPDVAIQVPPNLLGDALADIMECGVDDLGGISPLTIDHVNPEQLWPHPTSVSAVLKERLPVHPRFITTSFLSEQLYEKAISRVDDKGYVHDASRT